MLIQVFSDMGVLVKFTPVNHGGLPYEDSLLRMNRLETFLSLLFVVALIVDRFIEVVSLYLIG